MEDPSNIVVISWWSNTLGLACLQRLVKVVSSHKIHVIQVGKTAEQRQRFRKYLPIQVVELFYPQDAPGDHCKVLEEIVFEQLKDVKNLWVIDHDVFLYAQAGSWLTKAENWFASQQATLGLPILERNDLAITSPAFWLSPVCLPKTPSFFDPKPFTPLKEHQRPDLYLSKATIQIPEKDTLVQARDTLASQGHLAYYPLRDEESEDHPLSPFPTHVHLGGLSLFTLQPDSQLPRQWMNATVMEFSRFIHSCPPDWIEIEEPELLQRLKMYQDYLTQEADDAYPFDEFPRGRLNIGIPRKRFLSAMMDEVLVFSGKQQGGNAQVLSDLGLYPDERLENVKPVIVPESIIEVENDSIFGTPAGKDKRICLFSIYSPALSVFNNFNGYQSLGEAAEELSREYGWLPSIAFAYARGVFLALVVTGLAIPKEQA